MGSSSFGKTQEVKEKEKAGVYDTWLCCLALWQCGEEGTFYSTGSFVLRMAGEINELPLPYARHLPALWFPSSI